MTSSPEGPSSQDLDVGLLAPVSVGSAAEAQTSDRAFVQAMLDAEAALTRAQARLGLVPRAAAKAVTGAARADAFDLRALAVAARAGGNPVIPLVPALTAAVPASAAPYVHQGATSQDIIDTATMLVAARTLDPLLADLRRAALFLAALAARHRDTPMPGRTLTQHAVPTTFGLKAAGWRALLLDAHDRLAAVRAALPAQLGGAAGTLAAFTAAAGTTGAEPVATPATASASGPTTAGGDLGLRLVAAYSAELGLAEPALPWHVLRTPVADLGAALGFTTAALGKLAADVLTLSRTEIGELSEGHGGGSSAMPHKRNPVRATLIAAAARQVPALATVLIGALAAGDERAAGTWHAEWQPLREALRLTGGAARDAVELAEGLAVHTDRMRAGLDLTQGLIVSERLGITLAAVLGRDAARTALTEASRRSAQEGTPLADTLRDVLGDRFPPRTPAVCTDPTTYLGSAPALTDRALLRQPDAGHHPAPTDDSRRADR
ncbi:3-carboxy-cis,cis-muconate cycloisomerase [Streptomyces sp. PRB2-1]|uniref:3-carboxy-cis,cis-muconate cycloisomerase n=2 Tax=Actinacidiphila epipremni TaxID=2053013 RepID=A0ABX0ZXC1_9ACTN|nr:3-carboxy-cis,cis-muconate cycloisomerase [Actinacidiphila epipremni]NJP46364.1 3-carboxy-cis,cis-muconate cycloisomerase [Actinacidiphila epipremni]